MHYKTNDKRNRSKFSLEMSPIDGRQCVLVPLLRDALPRRVHDISSFCHDAAQQA